MKYLVLVFALAAPSVLAADRDADLREYEAAREKMLACYESVLAKTDTGKTPMEQLRVAVSSVCYKSMETACRSSRHVGCMSIVENQIVYAALAGRKKGRN